MLRCWLGGLLNYHIQQQKIKPVDTLFLIDEAAQLGNLPQLLQSLTLLRGYGIRAWTFWQDLSQIKSCYPEQWQTIINNSQVIQCFGISNFLSGKELSNIMGGISSEALLTLKDSEQVIQQRGCLARIAQKLNYLTDEKFSRFIFSQSDVRG